MDEAGHTSIDTDDVERLVNEAYIPPEDAEAGEFFRQWKRYTLEDAFQPRPPRKFLVDGLIACPSLSVLFGGPGSLKTMLLMDLALSVAAGEKWLDALPGDAHKPGITFPTIQAPVLWIDFDNGPELIHERFEALARGKLISPDVPLHYTSMPRPWLDMSQNESVENLYGLIRRLNIELLAIDNLRLVTGDVDENSGDMAQVMGNFRWLCSETRCAVVLIHHQRKSSGNGNDNFRLGEMLRGHSSIEAALDLALMVERKQGEDAVAIIPTKRRLFLKDAIFGAHFTYQHREGTRDLHSARFFNQQILSRAEAAILHIQTVIRQIIRQDGPCNQKDLIDTVRDTIAARPDGKAPGVNRVRGIIKTMVDDGHLLEAGHGRGRIYRLL